MHEVRLLRKGEGTCLELAWRGSYSQFLVVVILVIHLLASYTICHLTAEDLLLHFHQLKTMLLSYLKSVFRYFHQSRSVHELFEPPLITQKLSSKLKIKREFLAKKVPIEQDRIKYYSGEQQILFYHIFLQFGGRQRVFIC